MRVRSAILVCLTALATATPAGAGAAGAVQQASRVNSPTPSASAPAAAASTAADYVIGADDVLSVVFWRDQQLTGDVLVRPDGKISLPLLDDIQAAGSTPRQLRDRIITESKRFLTEPMVTVVVKQTSSRKVYITGMVLRPGQYPLTTDMTVLQLIATAGGLQDYAKVNDIRVVRVERGASVTLPFDYERIARGKAGKTEQNIFLKPGDTVIIP